MNARPFIVYPNSESVKVIPTGAAVVNCFIDEPGEVSFGTIDYVPGWFIALHHHHTWELIIIDGSSEGPGYTFFDGSWWRADPGCGVLLPKGYPHAWSSGNDKGFKMLWIYGGAHDEASRIYDTDPETFRPITPEEERKAPIWTAEAAGSSP
jgi:hypothetical protein